MTRRILFSLSLCLFLCAASGAALAQSYDYTGWWWDSQQGGTGYSLEVQCNKAYLVWYAYRDDGLNTWVSSILDVDGDTMAGELWRYEGWSLETGYQGSDATPEEKLGTVSLEFTGENAGSLTFAPEGGDEAVVRVLERRLTGEADPRNFNGWWWSTAKPGMGWFLEAKGSILSMGWFNFREAASRAGTNPRFYVTWAPFAPTDTVYQVPLLDYSGGQTLTGPYVAPSEPTIPGDLSVGILSTFNGAMDADPTDGPFLNLSSGGHTYRLSRFKVPGSDCTSLGCMPELLYAHPVGEIDLLRPVIQAIFDSPCGSEIDINSATMSLNGKDISYGSLLILTYENYPNSVGIRYERTSALTLYEDQNVVVTVADIYGNRASVEWTFYAGVTNYRR